MFPQNLKSVALPIPEIIGGNQKFGQSLDTLTLPFPKILMGFYSDWPVNLPAKFEVRGFTRSRDNRGYPQNLGTPWIRHAPFSPKTLMGFYSDWPSKCTCQI